MLELECLAAHRALELPLLRPVHVVGHMALQLGQVGELLRARLARLKFDIGEWISETINVYSFSISIATRQCQI